MGGAVKARLTNAVDEDLVRRGALARDQVRMFEADALVNTGAVRTVVPDDEVLIGQTVLEKLDLFVDIQGRRLVPIPPTPIDLSRRVVEKRSSRPTTTA